MDGRGRTRVAACAAVVVAATALACRKADSEGANAGAEAVGKSESAAAQPVDRHGAAMPALSWRLESPPSWDDRVRVVDDAEGATRLAEQGIHASTLFEYLPRDTSVVPQALLGVYVYDSTAWARVEAEDGPPQGEVVERGTGVVYVAAFPQSNPFGWGSADSAEFEKRSVTMTYVRRAFRVVR